MSYSVTTRRHNRAKVELNPHYESYIGRERELLVSCYNLLQVSFCVILCVIGLEIMVFPCLHRFTKKGLVSICNKLCSSFVCNKVCNRMYYAIVWVILHRLPDTQKDRIIAKIFGQPFLSANEFIDNQ